MQTVNDFTPDELRGMDFTVKSMPVVSVWMCKTCVFFNANGGNAVGIRPSTPIDQVQAEIHSVVEDFKKLEWRPG
ncbi:hypothetical protein [Acaryochloris sp. CCMEE 5410]|uniref:hypothetical protein n=1 Tax=Acaryochloris sp. CCMEE 5410 TaxID=310037 RepID=UPI0002485047|nr:hypothetical protein [Acaryochloris sp. CCMEE 5410]KAI9130114.1 hypothetical protein ON05_031295 [Acaryochloris sp. CCMEE 5410]